MTGLFFLVSLLFGWLAYNLFNPVYANVKGSALSFLAGWLTSELALHHILWQSGVVFLFIWGGAVSGFFGAIGFLICIAAWAAMAYHYTLSSKADNEMDEALFDGLGENYMEEINPEFWSQFPDCPDYERIKRPFTGKYAGVKVNKDVPFGDHGQFLDVYQPAQAVENAPVLFQIHGGAWTEKMGDKNLQALPLMNHMAQRGWVCVSADYRLSPSATFPDHIIDCKQALVWIKKEIASFGGNPDFIIVTGGSAGGHLSSLLALSQNDPAFQPGFEEQDTSVQAAVPFYGVYDLTDANGLQKNAGLVELMEKSVMKLPLQENTDVYQHASPLFRVHDKAPPFLIVHGDSDTLVPVEEARLLAAELKRFSHNRVAYAEISGGQHAFDMFASVRSEHVKQGVERFLAHTYSEYLNNQNPPETTPE